MSVYLYLLINVGIGVFAGLIFLIVKIATKPKMCDSCKRLVRKGGYWKYECRDKYGLPQRFDRCPVYCELYDPKEF